MQSCLHANMFNHKGRAGGYGSGKHIAASLAFLVHADCLSCPSKELILAYAFAALIWNSKELFSYISLRKMDFFDLANSKLKVLHPPGRLVRCPVMSFTDCTSSVTHSCIAFQYLAT